jgi:WD40 repeat protein
MSEASPAEAIFIAALERATAAERAAFLDEACAGDEGLRRRVERLLGAHVQAGAFLERPVAEAVDPAAAPRPETGEPFDFLAPSQRAGALGRLGHYEVLEVVGRGAMGVVLRAFDEKLQRVVAIKALAPQLATTGSARQRFVREARAAAAVGHEHVIAIHAVEAQGPVPYLVMQFVDGPTLQEKLDRGGPLPLREVLRIGLQVAAGLAAAHAHGLVHREVKPANILLENGVERVRITDFGLARAVDDASLTQSGLIAGTPAYMSPEQANGEHVDPRSDLFSLGSVLYTLCAGHPPFRAGSTMAVLKRVCDETPRPLREINPEVPDWLAAIIARLHAKNPTERYQSAAEVAELLGRRLAHLQQPSESLTSCELEAPVKGHEVEAPAKGHKPEAPARRNRFLSLALAACVAVLIAVGGIVLYGIFWGTQTAPEAPPWKPRPPLTLEELAKLPSPLDALKREAMELPGDAPPELLAVLGDRPGFALPERTDSHWMAQTGDGRLLAVPCGLNIVLFEGHTGKRLRTLTGHTGHPYRPAFSADGKRLAAGTEDFLVRLWDVATGREEWVLKGHTIWVWSVAFDDGRKQLVSADGGGTVKVWDAQGQLAHSFQGHTGGINQLAFSPGGKRLATASLDGTCKIWDPDNWKELRALPGKGAAFEAVAWSRDGKLLGAGDDTRVIVWNTETWEELHTLPTAGKGLIGFSPDGRTLLTARCVHPDTAARSFARWDLSTGTRHASFELPTRGVLAFFHLSPDGRTVFVSQLGNDWVGVYDAETGKPPRSAAIAAA